MKNLLYIIIFLFSCAQYAGNSSINNETKTNMDSTITIQGIARNTKAGALVMSGTEEYYIDGKASWDPLEISDRAKLG